MAKIDIDHGEGEWFFEVGVGRSSKQFLPIHSTKS